MKTWAMAYGAALLVLAVLDGIWLGIAARDFYQRELADLMAEQIRIVPALLFYLLYPAGVVTLGLWPRPPTLTACAARCGIVGALAYGTYDLTNLATLNGWSATLTIVDIVWGIVITAAMGAAAWRVSRAG